MLNQKKRQFEQKFKKDLQMQRHERRQLASTIKGRFSNRIPRGPDRYKEGEIDRIANQKGKFPGIGINRDRDRQYIQVKQVLRRNNRNFLGRRHQSNLRDNRKGKGLSLK